MSVYWFLGLILILVIMPLPVYFTVNQQYIQIYGFKILWTKVEKEAPKTVKKATNHKIHFKKDFKLLKKMIRLKKISLFLGYGLEMIDESMYFYQSLLIICPVFYSYLTSQNVDTYISIQHFPIQKSQIEGMFTICLARLIIDKIRR